MLALWNGECEDAELPHIRNYPGLPYFLLVSIIYLYVVSSCLSVTRSESRVHPDLPVPQRSSPKTLFKLHVQPLRLASCYKSFGLLKILIQGLKFVEKWSLLDQIFRSIHGELVGPPLPSCSSKFILSAIKHNVINIRMI